MPSFQPKPFPPPALKDVPIEYITDQLHAMGAQYWDELETADCTIIVPFPHAHGRPELPAFSSISRREPMFTYTSYDTASLGRRVTQPPLNAVPRISLALHIDYLAAHSSFLRGLFSGALPLDLMFSPNPPVSTNSAVPADRLPRLMPCSPDHPIVFLPVPDPTTFHLLIHWMYFGDLSIIENCLLRGLIQWEGIARNVEYLGLDADMKIFLRDWYSAWLDPDRISDGGESDTVYSDSEEEDDDDDCSTASELDDVIEKPADCLEKPALRTGVISHQPITFQSFHSLCSPSV
ncbi:hypothetical protein CPC08DRAFT_720028 [Agrocybe pediades]|nr:hypothetical protein CPC08DRAFT_720028 [Agrocybe pediades]